MFLAETPCAPDSADTALRGSSGSGEAVEAGPLAQTPHARQGRELPKGRKGNGRISAP